MIPIPPLAETALFFDVDGTLIDIAARPTEVVVPGALIDALHNLDGAVSGALALVSGRTVANLDELFSPLRLRSSGVHGAEFRADRDGAVAVAPDLMLPGWLMAAINGRLADRPGVLIENKIYSVAIHFRAAPTSGPAIRAALDAIVAATPEMNLVIMPGHMVFEVKRASFDKGMAIARFLDKAPFAGRTPIFLGDDVTDEPGFAAVLDRGGKAYAVGRASVTVTASFPHPQAVRAWLTSIVQSETTHA